LPELAITSVNPASRIASSSAWAPGSALISSSIASAPSTQAARMSSPWRASTSSPATAPTSWSPPMPIARWIADTGTVTP
jgi:hypothetical protein